MLQKNINKLVYLVQTNPTLQTITTEPDCVPNPKNNYTVEHVGIYPCYNTVGITVIGNNNIKEHLKDLLQNGNITKTEYTNIKKQVKKYIVLFLG